MFLEEEENFFALLSEPLKQRSVVSAADTALNCTVVQIKKFKGAIA
jgi:hypothetical protein